MSAPANNPAETPVVAIIGGGFTGASVAWHLARAVTAPAQIVVIEPRPKLGQGLAYSTADPSHRINVPAARMTMDCADEGGLQKWIEAARPDLSPGTEAEGGGLFPQRGLVADYVSDNLAPLLASGQVRHVQSVATWVHRGERFCIFCQDGTELEADLLVIASGHPPPGIPQAFRDLEGSPRLIADSAQAGRISQVAAEDGEVLVVGTGLTAADVIASLDRQGFQGRITALSRRGLRSRGHVFGYPESPSDFATRPARSALELLRNIRAAVRLDIGAGLPWQATLDNVRRDGPAIWAALDLAQRARLLKKLRVWWDVHRFRIAPQVAGVLDRLIDHSRLRILAARLLSAQQDDTGLWVEWRTRGGKTGRGRFDRVILATGPAHDSILHSSPVLASLADAGLVRPDALRLGLDVTEGCLAVGSNGQPTPGILVAGPLARSHVGELMGVPEVTAHAELVAARLAASLARAERSLQDADL